MTQLAKLWEFAYMGTVAYENVYSEQEIKKAIDLLLNYWPRVACPELDIHYKALKARAGDRKK